MDLAPAHNEAGDVVVLRGGTHELIENLHNFGEGQRGSLFRDCLEQRRESGLSEFLMIFVSGLGDAIGVDDQQIQRFQARSARLVGFL